MYTSSWGGGGRNTTWLSPVFTVSPLTGVAMVEDVQMLRQKLYPHRAQQAQSPTEHDTFKRMGMCWNASPAFGG